MAININAMFKMFSDAADGVFAVNEEQRIIYWNEAAEHLLGFSAEDVVGQSCHEIIAGKDGLECLICRKRCNIITSVQQSEETISNYDACVQTNSGETRWVNVSTLVFHTANNGASPIIIHLFRDAAEKKYNEQFIAQVLGATHRLQAKVSAAAEAEPPPPSPTSDLTDREREVLSLLVNGLSTEEIARTLSISPATSRNHIQNILHKLRVHSRLEAVTYALQHGFSKTQ